MVATERQIWPLDAPGMPLPEGDFVKMAEELGDPMEFVGKGKHRAIAATSDTLAAIYEDVLYSQGEIAVKLSAARGKTVVQEVVGGHRWGHIDEWGPVQSDVMVVGKMMRQDDFVQQRHFMGDTGDLLVDVFSKYADEEELADWYMTNLVKTHHPDGFTESTLKQSFKKRWIPLLHQELRLVRPRFLLCLGADAGKALFGKDCTISKSQGRVMELTIPVNLPGEPLEEHTILCMVIPHPLAVLATPELEEQFENAASRFVMLTEGQRWDQDEEGIDHFAVDTLPKVRELVKRVNKEIKHNLLAVDAEWHGQHPQNEGAYLRCVQFAWREKTAAVVVLRRQDGSRVFTPREEAEVTKILMEMCKGKQITGHFLDADLEWLVPWGLDLRPQFLEAVSPDWVDYMAQVLRNKETGFDTGIACHALNETDDFSLTTQSLRIGVPRYDIPLLEWKKRYCKEHGLKDAELEGFGPCPDDILLGAPTPEGRLKNSYACYDADATWRIAVRKRKQLCKDSYGLNCYRAMHMTMRALPAILEMNTTGITLDRERVDKLTEDYMEARDKLQKRIQEYARWTDRVCPKTGRTIPGLNLNSVYEVREFLFGERFNGKLPDENGNPVRLRPEGAKSLKLTPIITTDKRPMPWTEVVKKGLEDEKTPSTDKMALAILAQESQAVRRRHPDTGEIVEVDYSDKVNWIRDYRFISQVLKSVLRPPKLEESEDDEPDVYALDDDGYYLYAGGLPSAICSDQRVRTHIYPTKETRRWSSARPPLQNLSKRREKDYKRILEDKYSYALRSVLCASPGHVLIEADYVGAELFGMAVMSGDATLIDHATRNQLPEDHPDYYDIHSNIAVMAFRLDCPPTKAGLEVVGKKELRIVAKSVIFGVAYGRGAKAIALAAKEEKVYITVEEAQAVIDAIFETYPGLVDFFDRCRARVQSPRYICNCFANPRRVPVARDNRVIQDFERQFMNYPLQGMIADAVSRAVDVLYTERKAYDPEDFTFKMVLQIHDAVIFEVPNRHAEYMADNFIPRCMRDGVPIFRTDLSGVRTGGDPYYLGVDTEIFDHFGELMYPEEFLERQIPMRLGGWSEHESGGYQHIHKTGKVWKGGKWLELQAA